MKSSVIARGNLKTSGESYYMCFLNLNDVQEMLELQQEVQNAVKNASSLQVLSKQEFEYILAGKGFVIGTYLEERMIAFRAMLEPPVDDPEHLGIDAGLSKEDLHKVIYSEITVVHPVYRGNGLQTDMGNIVMKHVNKERFSYVAATVAPFNIPSLKDKLALGMEIIGLKEKYEGVLRYIFLKKLGQDGMKHDGHEKKRIPMETTERQQELLNSGYKGIAISYVNETHQVTFRK